MFRNQERLVNIFRNSKLSCRNMLIVLKNLSHATMCDLSLLMSGELSLFNVVQKQSQVSLQYTIVSLLSYFYERQVIQPKDDIELQDRKDFYNDYVKNYAEHELYGRMFAIDF